MGTSRIPFQAERKISENLKKPRFEGPIDISALRKEINNSSVAQLQNVIRILERQHEEKKSYEREQRELKTKITAIKRKIEERKRGKGNVQNNGYRKRHWEVNRRKQFEKRQRVKK